MDAPHLRLPVDEPSRVRLAADGLELRVVDPADATAFAAWHRAVGRGFHGPRDDDEKVEHRRTHGGDERRLGVYDPTSAEPGSPVGSTSCWPVDLTVPGGTVPAWAVSGVTVAPTHRRRGLARALMHAELRTAVSLGRPVAALTVSESTIYGRFGYAPAAFARDVTVLTRRARWTGPEPTGRVHFVSPERLRDDGPAVVDRVRAGRPGEITYEGHLWERQLGLAVGDRNAPRLGCVRYDDATGTPQGFAVYQLEEDPADFANHTLRLHTLVSATTDAYAGLWRFLLEMDLVGTVSAHLRPVDEPLRWMIDDFRAVRVTEVDHLWVRVVDVAAALAARTYAQPGRLVLDVDDDLGFAHGTWALDVRDDGTARVSPTDDAPDARLAVTALGALYLGGVPAAALAAAGTLTGDVDRVGRTFRSTVEPYLSIWF